MIDEYVLNEKGIAAVHDFKARASKFFEDIENKIPECREKSLFYTKMEEACFFAVRAISSKDGNHDSKKKFIMPKSPKKK